MKNKDRTDSYMIRLLKIIRKQLPHCKVYLYGSRARKSHSSGSDIDVALDTGKKLDYKIIFKIKNDIEESTLPVFVDVVDVHGISDDMKKQIQQDGILWN